ncbi:hypothetical protein [Falsiroseomonas sp. E2-1-a20]|uniref:hypothetical protein n=1 Tax=Falsiroseomonas sp. E2-1-a20 TaxID=3239300 RepID=UPI003F405450
MTLHYRKRGEVWHCRGSVRVGRRSFEVREFSTGCRNKAEAEAVGAAEEARIRAEFLNSGTAVDRLATSPLGPALPHLDFGVSLPVAHLASTA